MDFDLEELAAIIEQLDKTEFTDFSFEKGDLRIRVKRGGSIPEATHIAPGTAQQALAVPERTDASAPGSAPAPARTAEHPDDSTHERPPTLTTGSSSDGAAGAAAPAETDTRAAERSDLVTITAPMLGHFYRSPKPGEPPFVSVGDTVEEDSNVCIIEVMKLMNSVPAQIGGEIAEVYVEDGQLVEFDQPLFGVQAAS